MKKRIIFLSLLLGMTAAMASAQRVFHHPGGILGQADINRIKTHVEAGDNPWASLWKDFQQMDGGYASSTYTANPNTEIGGSNGNRQRASRDALAAYVNALEWHVTGETKYADCAARILTAWGNKLETANAELFQYPSEGMVVAAEMLRDSTGAFYAGWAEADRNTFLSKVRTVIVPACKQFCTWVSHPSWYTPCAATVIAAGVLLDDEQLYQDGYDLMTAKSYWGPIYGGTIESDGQVREMARDNVHGGLSLFDICVACYVCWNQGDDLFAEGDNLLLKGMNYWCRYNTGHKDTPYKPLPTKEGNDDYTYYFISQHNNGFRLRPDAACFEAVYHHYKEVKGIDIEKDYPYLGYAVRLARPERNATTMGYGTLLFTIDPATSEYMTKRPARTKNPVAEAGLGCVYLSWDHPADEDVRGFKIWRSTSANVDVSGEPYVTWDYYTNNEYRDTNVEPGTTYYYKIKPFNLAGETTLASKTVSATPVAAGALADGWTLRQMGNTVSTAGYAAGVQDTTIVVNGAGTDIGGTSDDQGFVYRKISGDVTLTARIASVNEDFLKQGLMIRANLLAEGARVALVKGEKGYRLLRVGTRTASYQGTSWANGSNYIYAPVWLRLTRQGNTVTAYVSRDGSDGSWIKVSESQLTLPETVYVGVGCCSGDDSKTTQTVFDHVSVVNKAISTGINNATATFNHGAERKLYDLAGRPLASAPRHGAYIVKQGDKVSKHIR